MDAQVPAVFLRSLSAGLRDARRHNVRHRFTGVLAVAVPAVVCRADDGDEVAVYGRANRAGLATFLELPDGIPSADTSARPSARPGPAACERAIRRSLQLRRDPLVRIGRGPGQMPCAPVRVLVRDRVPARATW